MLPYLTSEWPGCGGRARVEPEDFVVEEVPAYAPSGAGEHLYLWIEKRAVDTPKVVRALSAALGVPEREIGYAGLKDRWAVTRQLFSVPARVEEKVSGFALEGAQVLWTKRHGNKLRSGHLRGNRFTLRLRGVQEAGAARASFEHLASEGLPNFFGPQRFGARGDNAENGFLLLRGQRLPVRPERFQRKLYLSAAQSLLFNEALAARLKDGTWARALEGDVLRKLDSGGAFVCEDPAVDQPRVDRFEVSPAGPMFGPKLLAARGAVAEAEAALLKAHGLTASDFLRGGDETQGARRPYRIRLETPAFEAEGEDVVIAFTLPAGSYATVVLRELLKEDAEGPAEED